MTLAIWNYPVPIVDNIEIWMPRGALPGHSLGSPSERRYVGTAIKFPFVWHLFEVL